MNYFDTVGGHETMARIVHSLEEISESLKELKPKTDTPTPFQSFCVQEAEYRIKEMGLEEKLKDFGLSIGDVAYELYDNSEAWINSDRIESIIKSLFEEE